MADDPTRSTDLRYHLTMDEVISIWPFEWLATGGFGCGKCGVPLVPMLSCYVPEDFRKAAQRHLYKCEHHP